MSKKITVDGVDYYSKEKGRRHIVVLDRGFIFVGDLSEGERVSTLADCYNIRKWDSGGFGGMEVDPKGSGVVLDKCSDKIFKPGAEIFMTPVSDSWGK